MTVGGSCCDGVLSPRSPQAYAGGRRAAGRRSHDVVVRDGELERRPPGLDAPARYARPAGTREAHRRL